MATPPSNFLFSTTWNLLSTKDNSASLGAAAVEEETNRLLRDPSLKEHPGIERLQALQNLTIERRARRETDLTQVRLWHTAATIGDVGGLAATIFAQIKGKLSPRLALLPAAAVALHTGYEQFHTRRETTNAYLYCEKKRNELANRKAAVIRSIHEEAEALSPREEAGV
jgi:hypothetical protein